MTRRSTDLDHVTPVIMNDPHHLVEEFVEHSTENLCSVALQEAGSRQRSYENPAKRLAKQKKKSTNESLTMVDNRSVKTVNPDASASKTAPVCT